MKNIFISVALLLAVPLMGSPKTEYSRTEIRQYAQLPSFSQVADVGVAGAFAGTIGDRLYVMCGTCFPNYTKSDYGEKFYSNEILEYDMGQKRWNQISETFPNARSYGVSLTVPEGILCIGGNDGLKVFSDVTLVRQNGAELDFQAYPSLPQPLTNMGGALIGRKVYIVGGQNALSEYESLNSVYYLDLDKITNGWKKIADIPGKPRIFPVVVSQNDGNEYALYVFSGRYVSSKAPLKVLTDGYKYTPSLNSWIRLDTDTLQFPFMAASASAVGMNHITIFGGADKSFIEQSDSLEKVLLHYIATSSHIDRKYVAEQNRMITEFVNTQPPFNCRIYGFDCITNTLVELAEYETPLPVTTVAVPHQNHVYICCGEIAPGRRSSQILEVSVLPHKQAFGWINYAVIIAYFAVLIWIGYYCSRKQKSSDNYFKGDGNIPWWAVGLSIFGTALSAITFMAIPAKAYATDWSYMLMNSGIVLVAPLIVWLFIPFYRRLNITTAYQYLEERFNLTTRLLCSISFILFQIGRMGVVILLPSIAINVLTGVDLLMCILFIGVISLIYTMIGGIEAVIWTDVFQVIVLLGGALFTIFYILFQTDGGFHEVIRCGVEESKMFMGSAKLDWQQSTIWTVIVASIFANLTTYATDQTMVQRYLTTKDIKQAQHSVWMNAGMTIPATIIFFFVGTCLYVFYKNRPETLDVISSGGDAIFPWFIVTQLPVGLSGLLIAGILAAAMSTLSGSMNSAATAYCVDFHYRFNFTPTINRLKIARISTLIVGSLGIIFAIVMSKMSVISLWDEFQKILGLVLGTLGGLFLLGILSRRASGTAAVIAIACSVFLQMLVSRYQVVHLLLYAVTGFVACFVLGYLFSFIFPNRKKIFGMTIHKK